MAAGGKMGNKGGGRYKESDQQIQIFKGLAWKLINKRCTNKNEATAEKWIDKYTTMFANKLMPQQVEGSGNNGAFIFKFEE